MNRKTKKLVQVLCAIWLTLLVTTTAYAVTVTINTNDGHIDGNWGSVTMLRDDPDGDAVSSDRDIDAVWITNENDYSRYYFRMDYVGTPHGDYIPVAKLDCNLDNDYTDPEDVWVYYDHFADEAGECAGNSTDCVNDAAPDDYSSDGGEIPETNRMEWRGESGGNVTFANCHGQINVLFQIAYINDDPWTYSDSTVARGYNVPTAVELTNVSGSSKAHWYLPLGVIVVGLLGLGLWNGIAVFQRKKSA
jgi:hypothetical protein